MRAMLVVGLIAGFGPAVQSTFSQSAVSPGTKSASGTPKKSTSAAPVTNTVKSSGLAIDDVVKMLDAKLSEAIIVGQVKKNNVPFDLSPVELITLKKASASDGLLEVLMDPSKPYVPPAVNAVPPAAQAMPASVAAPVSQPQASSTPAEPDLPMGADIGAYFKKGGKWEEMLPEVVNWKTGGIIKNIASAGIVKGDVNGHIPGAHSRNSATSPLEVVLYAPEGVAITEYQLIHLDEQSDSREFRTVTGGVLHASGGATRDVIPFEGKKVASRVYRILLPPSFGAGEYGFLPPGAMTSSNSASIGKIYTFRLIE